MLLRLDPIADAPPDTVTVGTDTDTGTDTAAVGTTGSSIGTGVLKAALGHNQSFANPDVGAAAAFTPPLPTRSTSDGNSEHERCVTHTYIHTYIHIYIHTYIHRPEPASSHTVSPKPVPIRCVVTGSATTAAMARRLCRFSDQLVELKPLRYMGQV